MAKKAIAKAKSAPSAQRSNKTSKPASKLASKAGAKTSGKSEAKAVKPAVKEVPVKASVKNLNKNANKNSKSPVAKAAPKIEKAALKAVAKAEAPLIPAIAKVPKKSEVSAKNSRVEAAPTLMSKAAEPVVETQDKGPTDKVEKKAKKIKELIIDRTSDLGSQWNSLFEKSKGLKPASYKMSDNYEARTPLQHKVLGWGYVISSQNNRLEVLFKDGIKILIANYKG